MIVGTFPRYQSNKGVLLVLVARAAKEAAGVA